MLDITFAKHKFLILLFSYKYMANKLLLTDSSGRVRLIAAFEILKGLLSLALVFGIMESLSESLNEAAQELVLGLHLNPEKRIPDMFIDSVSSIHPGQVWIVIGSAIIYSIVRFAEGYGLWNKHQWAAWVSALSGAVYLPLEAYELWKKVSWFHIASAVANIAITGYMIFLLCNSYKGKILRECET